MLLGQADTRTRRAVACAVATTLTLTLLGSLPLAAPARAAGSGGIAVVSSGGAGLSVATPLYAPAVKPPATAPASHVTPAPPGASSRGRGKWLTKFTVSEYWPVPESWFSGAQVAVPGLPGMHRVDWLYSARGVSMQGEGLGLDGRMYHLDSFGNGGWVTAQGKTTDAAKAWTGGAPYWRAGAYWKNAHGAVTFPLSAGGWSNGNGVKYVPLPNVSFAPGASLPLTPYGSIAVDPKVIPLGSLVYLAAYAQDGHAGWFVAQDTGGAIKGHRIDVYRTPPASPATGGQYLTGEQAYVIQPGQLLAQTQNRRAVQH